MTRLYVGNLAFETTDNDLRAAFSQFGEVVSARVMSDRRGRTKRFGYVQMEDEAGAQAAIEGMRSTQINGRTPDVVIEERSGGRPRPARRR